MTPGEVFTRLAGKFQSENQDEANVKVMRKAAEADTKPMADFKLNAGVPMLTPEEAKKSAKLSSLRSSVVPDKEAEEKAAMLSVTDPNWKAPSIDLLVKKQSPADAGDIQANAHIIQDTLREFSIDVEMEGANIGPKVTQYTLRPPAGIKLNRITALETNIALNLAASSLRMEAPIQAKNLSASKYRTKKPLTCASVASSTARSGSKPMNRWHLP